MSYDRALTVFSPDGHLFQVEYAMEAVHKGTLAVKIRSINLFPRLVSVESMLQCWVWKRRLSPSLQDPRPVKKICILDDHLCAAFAGIMIDPYLCAL